MKNKHQSYDLAQMQSLPLSAKIIITEQRIKQWYDTFDGEVYVSVSGGKDSQVLAHIVKNLYPDVPCVFVNTGLEYDSVRLKGIELSDEVLRPGMNFVQVVTKYGYPVISKEVSKVVYDARNALSKGNNDSYAIKQLNNEYINPKTGELSVQYNRGKWKFLLDAPFTISNRCCDIMKKSPAHKFNKSSRLKPIIGTMASESRQRKNQWLKFGCNSFDSNNPASKPLSFWTEQDILQYIKLYNLDIASIYGDIILNDKNKLETMGENRTGCVFCMFGIKQDTDRFLRLKDKEPKKYDFVMRGGKFDEGGMWIPHNGLGYKFVIDWLNEHGGLNIRY